MGVADGSLVSDLKSRAQADFNVDTTRFLFFDDRNTVLCSSFKVIEQELAPLKSVFSSSRENTVRSGVRFNGQRFEVHRFDPPLVYGRTMIGDPVHSEAFALCRVESGPTGVPAYGVITFVSASVYAQLGTRLKACMLQLDLGPFCRLPNLTAKMVPQLRHFCDAHLNKAVK